MDNGEHTRWIIPAAVSQMEMNIEMSWASLKEKKKSLVLSDVERKVRRPTGKGRRLVNMV